MDNNIDSRLKSRPPKINPEKQRKFLIQCNGLKIDIFFNNDIQEIFFKICKKPCFKIDLCGE